jgi:hypothetical protein
MIITPWESWGALSTPLLLDGKKSLMTNMSPFIFSSMAATRLFIEAEASPTLYVIWSQGQALTGIVIGSARQHRALKSTVQRKSHNWFNQIKVSHGTIDDSHETA